MRNAIKRTFLVVLVLLAMPIGLAPAHGATGIDHATVIQDTLAPGQKQQYALQFSEGPLREGWLFALVGRIWAGSADLTLLTPTGEVAGFWRWAASDALRWEGVALPQDGEYQLQVASVGTEALRFSIYYDQSCFCAEKPLPLVGGVAIFHGSAAVGSRVEARLSATPEVALDVQVAYRVTPRGQWPNDYQLVEIWREQAVQSADGVNEEIISFTAASDDPFYMIVRSPMATETVRFAAQIHSAQVGMPTWPFLISVLVLVVALASLGIMLVRLRHLIIPRKRGGKSKQNLM
jgi:hypothetical protein